MGSKHFGSKDCEEAARRWKQERQVEINKKLVAETTIKVNGTPIELVTE